MEVVEMTLRDALHFICCCANE